MGGHCLFIPPKQHGGRALSVPIPQTERGAGPVCSYPPNRTGGGTVCSYPPSPHSTGRGTQCKTWKHGDISLPATWKFFCQLSGLKARLYQLKGWPSSSSLLVATYEYAFASRQVLEPDAPQQILGEDVLEGFLLHGRFLNLMLPSSYLEKTFWKVFCFATRFRLCTRKNGVALKKFSVYV